MTKSSRYAHLEVSRTLLDHGANVDATERNYWTPVHISTGNQYFEIVKLLLECGADIHANEVRHRTEEEIEISDPLWKTGAGRLGRKVRRDTLTMYGQVHYLTGALV